MIKMDKGLCQIVLYCHDAFHVTDIIEDLKILIGKRSARNPQDIKLNDIYWHLTQIILQCSSVYQDPYYLYNFILSTMFKWSNNIDITEMIKLLVCHISLLPTKQDEQIILELGEPDYSWLSKPINE